MMTLVEVSVTIVCLKMALPYSSGRTISLFLFCQIVMEQRFHQSKEPKKMVPNFPCLVAVIDYNKYMGRVDKAGMLCAIQGLCSKSKKWWHRIFFGIMDQTVVNAQIVYSKLEGKPLSVLEYRRAVTQALITRETPPKVGRPRSPPVTQEPAK